MYSGEVGRTVRVFHLSDLHGRSKDGPQGERARREAPLRWRVIRGEWDRNLAALREDGRPVDLVVFTGDLADWGHETDYAMGVEFRMKNLGRARGRVRRISLRTPDGRGGLNLYPTTHLNPG